jgi:hypothetical protein
MATGSMITVMEGNLMSGTCQSRTKCVILFVSCFLPTMGDQSANVTVRNKVLTGKEIKGLAADKQKKKILEARLDVQAIAEILDDGELLEQPGAAVILRLREVLSKGNVSSILEVIVVWFVHCS